MPTNLKRYITKGKLSAQGFSFEALFSHFVIPEALYAVKSELNYIKLNFILILFMFNDLIVFTEMKHERFGMGGQTDGSAKRHKQSKLHIFKHHKKGPLCVSLYCEVN